MGEYTNALVSALQGASNAAASNISGPVDLIAWALRKAGVPVPSNPVMGSDWMRQKGLLAEPQSKMAGLLGEGLGMAAPAVAAAKAPQIARGLLNVADDFQAYNKALGPAGVSQATVWHGSPHKFDRFDSSKIGTGEGAQAYGHGLYLADAKDTAQVYRDQLSKVPTTSYVANGREIIGGKEWHAADIADTMRRGGIDPKTKEGKEWLASELGARYMGGVDDLSKSHVMNYLKGTLERKKELGALYKVDLPDPLISRMLDWDKPLSQQPETVAELATVFGLSPQTTGAQAYDALTKKFGTGVRETLDKAGQSSAASVLRQRGIPGIRYLDGGSRGAGAGTSNYVVFPGEESALTILERNGSPVNALVKALQGPR